MDDAAGPLALFLLRRRGRGRRRPDSLYVYDTAAEQVHGLLDRGVGLGGLDVFLCCSSAGAPGGMRQDNAHDGAGAAATGDGGGLWRLHYLSTRRRGDVFFFGGGGRSCARLHLGQQRFDRREVRSLGQANDRRLDQCTAAAARFDRSTHLLQHGDHVGEAAPVELLGLLAELVAKFGRDVDQIGVLAADIHDHQVAKLSDQMRTPVGERRALAEAAIDDVQRVGRVAVGETVDQFGEQLIVRRGEQLIDDLGRDVLARHREYLIEQAQPVAHGALRQSGEPLAGGLVDRHFLGLADHLELLGDLGG